MTPTKFLDKFNHLPRARTRYILLLSLCLLAIMVAIFVTQSRNDVSQVANQSLVTSDDDWMIKGFEIIHNEYFDCLDQHYAGTIEADTACIAANEEKTEAMYELLQKTREWSDDFEEYHYGYDNGYQYQHEYRDEHKSEYRLYR